MRARDRAFWKPIKKERAEDSHARAVGPLQPMRPKKNRDRALAAHASSSSPLAYRKPGAHVPHVTTVSAPARVGEASRKASRRREVLHLCA